MNIAGIGKRVIHLAKLGVTDVVTIVLCLNYCRPGRQEIFNMRLGKMLSDISRATLLLFLFAREICFRTESQKFASYRQSTLL